MTDKEMIEEMAEIIYENRPNKDIWIEDATEIAKVLLSAGYRKVPEGSVVLTKEEHMQMIKDCIESNKITSQTYYERGSKETAKEILEKLVGHTFEDDGWTWTVSKEDIQWLANKYGVEVEE